MKEVIAMHGWGGDGTIWNRWEKYFRLKGWIWQSAERGYGAANQTQPKWIQSFENNSQHQRVFIGHSLGAHLIKKQILGEATDIVLISSFGRFISEERESRSLKTALKGMKKSIGTTKEEDMLKAFTKKAFYPQPINALEPIPVKNGLSCKGRNTLKNDLELLINTSGLPCGFPREARVLTIYGQKDPIVVTSSQTLLSQDLKKHLKNQLTSWTFSEEGHYLFNSEIIDRVENWLEVSK